MSTVTIETKHKVVHFENVTTWQPVTLPSHFCSAKDARKLRAREGSLDSLTRPQGGRE